MKMSSLQRTACIFFICATAFSSYASVWINELHYDNASTDTGEGVEVAGSAGTDLTGYSLLAYNGSGGAVYDTLDLSGTIDDEGCGYGALWFDITGLQNGPPDGIALVDASSTVLQFLSYEGSFTATDGPASGMTSTDIGVSETSSTPVGQSLQLSGTGNQYSDFTWSAPAVGSVGDLNSTQTISPCGAVSNQPPVLASIGNKSATVSNTVTFSVSAADSVDGDQVNIWMANAPAGATLTPTTGVGSVNGTFTWNNASPVGVYTTTFYAADIDGTNSETITITLTESAPQTSGSIWINELHYDNDGTDSGEGVEVAGPAGTDLTPYSLLAYNGNGGTVYDTLDLSGTIDDEGCGYGALWFDMGLQNGSPDGVALVDGSSNVLEFLSYEGVITATDGPANGMDSTDIGVSEPASSPVGYSLQLVGTGTNAAGFTWIAPTNSSNGSLNDNQSITGCGGASNQPPVLASIGNKSAAVSNTVTFSVSAADSVDGDQVNIWMANAPAGATLTPTTGVGSVNGTFTWNNASPVGVYTTTFYAADIDGTNSETITITLTPPYTAPALVISEIMNDPSASLDSNGEWFELYNNSATPIDIDGYTIKDDGSNSHIIDNGGPLNVPAYGFLVLGINSDTATNGNVTVDYEYSSFQLGNTDDEVVLLDTGLNEVARVNYDGGTAFPDPSGASMYLIAPDADQQVGANWAVSTIAWTGSAGDFGSPGSANEQGSWGGAVSNQPPVLASIGNQSATVSNTVTFSVSAADSVDGDQVNIWMANAPAGATLTPTTGVGSVNGTFTWNNASPVGVYTTTFYAADIDGTNSETITITLTPPYTAPALVISEIMNDPSASDDSNGEWFELYNNSATPIDIDGYTIKDDGSNSHIIDNGDPLNVPAYGFLVLGINSDTATNGNVTVDYEYSSFQLSNTDDEVVLLDTGLNEVARVNYDGGTAFPDPSGASMYLIAPDADQQVGANWAVSTIAWTGSAGDFGSPGSANEQGSWDLSPDAPLITITNPATASVTVPNGTTSYLLRGTCNSNCIGMIRWTNSVGISGSQIVSPTWIISMGLDLGTNLITITATNAGGAASSDSVTIIRSMPVGGDSDSDGIADDWEIKWFGNTGVASSNSHSDADGASDMEEYIADTDPTSDASFFDATITGVVGQASFSFMAGPPTTNSRVYDLWYSTNLLTTPQSWQRVGLSQPGAADGSAVQLQITNASPNRMYRIGVALP